MDGTEFRVKRVSIGYSQKRFGALFGLTDQTIAIWEKQDKVPKWAAWFMNNVSGERDEKR